MERTKSKPGSSEPGLPLPAEWKLIDPGRARRWLTSVHILMPGHGPAGAWSPCQWLARVTLGSPQWSERTLTAQLQLAPSAAPSWLRFQSLCLQCISAFGWCSC